MLAIKEQLIDLDFEEIFIEKLLKDYSPKKIEEKIDLLLIKRNIQNPAGWLRVALKNNYQDPEQERYDEEPAEKSEDDKCRGTMHRALNESGRIDPFPTENADTPEQVSREKDLKAIKLIQNNLSTCISPIPSCRRTRFRKNVGVRFIEPVKSGNRRTGVSPVYVWKIGTGYFL